jgi:hypothetical protein
VYAWNRCNTAKTKPRLLLGRSSLLVDPAGMRQRVCNRIEDRPCIAEKTAKAGNVKTFENDTRLQDAMTKLFPATNSQPKPRFAFSRWQSCQLLRTWPLAGDRAASALLMSRRKVPSGVTWAKNYSGDYRDHQDVHGSNRSTPVADCMQPLSQTIKEPSTQARAFSAAGGDR